jgi:hypothetical protein
MILDTPNELKQKLGLGNFNFSPPSTYILTVTDNDYQNGYIKRYFASNRNYFNVIETDAKSYHTIDVNYYRKISIDWKITGPEFNLYNGKILQTTGVVNYNVLRIKEANSVIKGIETVLNNPRQFWRGY